MLEPVPKILKPLKKLPKSVRFLQTVTVLSANILPARWKKVGNEGVITVEDAKGLETELDVVEGMQFDRGYLSPYFITNPDKMNCEFENPFILAL